MSKRLKQNPKAVAARERKAQAEMEKAIKEITAAEDAKWTDQGSTRKEQRARERQEKEAKKMEARQKKKALLEEDNALMASVKTSSKARQTLKEHGLEVTKVTQYDLMMAKVKQEEEMKRLEKERELKDNKILTTDYSKFENQNRGRSEQLRQDEEMYGKGNVVHASSIDSAIKGLSILEASAEDLKVDRFPEKRRKAAYKKFYAERMPELREEYPTLKLSQLKEILFKEWLKSDQNPENQ